MANKKPVNKSSKSSAANKKNNSKKSSNSKTNTSAKNTMAKISAADRQKKALVLFAVSIIMFAVTLIKGESLWAAIHNFVFGLFGICAFVWPLIMIYLAVTLSLNKENQSSMPKVIGVSVFTLLLEAIVHVAFIVSDDINFGEQITKVWELRNEITIKSGGFFGAIIGGGLNSLAGKTGTMIILIVVEILIFMLFTGKTLKDAGNAVYKPAKKVKNYTEEKINTNIENKRLRKPVDPQHRKNGFNAPEIGPNATPGFDEINPDDTIYIEELAGNAAKAEAEKEKQENIDDIIKNMAPVKDPLVPVDVSKTEPADMKPKKEKAKEKVEEIPSVSIEKNPENGEIIEKHEYKKPDLDCLNVADISGALNYEQEVKQNAQKLEETLHNFDVNAKLVGICRGPSVTRYELQPAPGVKISKITGLSDDIALAMAATGVRMEAPIPGKAAVGIEIPNKTRATVSLREIIQTPEYETQVSKSKLAVAVGKNITGESIICDLAKMPHLLVAGTTGSGKSVCLNSMIISILYNATPDEVKLLMIDPKQVEFTVYNGIPHLLVPVVADPKKAAGALGWAVTEMLKRYKMFSEKNVRDIKGYNRLARAEEFDVMPQIVIFIDELSDLMMAARKEVEDSICRLAQMARAAGMHLVIATQRPSVDVITGVIKGNIPSRVALSVSSQVDSRTIIDASGAETLLGNGDMLYAPIGVAKPVRVQGCFVSDTEVENVVNFIKSQKDGEVTYDDSVNEAIEINAREVGEKKKAIISGDSDDDSDSDADEMLPKAIEVVVESQMASTTLLQRKLKLGYARAARLMDSLEERGIVGPFEGSKPRKVLISREQWMEMNALGNASPAREKPYGEEDDENY